MEQNKKCKFCQKEIDINAKRCPYCHGDLRNFINRHPVITVILFLIGLWIFSGIMSAISNSENNSNIAPVVSQPVQPVISTTQTPIVSKKTAVVKSVSQPMQSPVATPTPTPVQMQTPSQTPQTNNQNTSPVSNETVSQKNAVAKAMDYLSYSGFSHDGLVAQLEYDQFSQADAVYGADNSGANWDEQAALKAKDYMSYSAFSRGGLIEQLEYDKFTQEQAEYGANAVGL